MGYVFRECLLAPHNFGVPNDRLRYFLMARLRSSFEGVTSTSSTASAQSTREALETFDPEKEIIYTMWPFPAFVEDPKTPIIQHNFKLPELQHFLDQDKTQAKDYLLSRQLILERPNFRFDILRPSSNRSSCFTKAYGSHHVASGGGLLQTQKIDQTEYDFSNSESIADLGLRFFSPTEVARLHVFPLNEKRDDDNAPEISESSDEESITEPVLKSVTTVRPFNPRLAQNPNGPFLQFPEKLKALQRYKLLGNSLNVWVVAELLRAVLFADHSGTPQPLYREPGFDIEGTKHDIEETGLTSNDGDPSDSDTKRRDTKRFKAE
ncbi:tRNA (cytosine-5-)-methyltransferase [Mortierella sp. AM989]|nr:tRNA (cytosine-5-)-methyltransferase [Mortierella sp. AM989]